MNDNMRKFTIAFFFSSCLLGATSGLAHMTFEGVKPATLDATVKVSEPKFIYTPATHLTLVGKAADEGAHFHRVDTAKYNTMPAEVKKLFTNSSGLAISFVTNSTVIKARWTVPNRRQGGNMTPIMQKGLDLYIKRDGQWVYAGVGSPNGVTSNRTLVENMDSEEKECLLYLPLYDEITDLEIGVDRNAYLRKGVNPFKGKYVVYGSSITQGASASRPGLAYPAQLSRSTGLNFINMGLSGNGKMEPEVGRMLVSIKNVDAFILDCVPNPSPDEIRERTVPFVKQLRKSHPKVPIIIIQSVVREKGNFNLKVRERVHQQNIAIAEQVKILQNMGIKNLHFIKEDSFLGTDHEGSIDGDHPTDVGFERLLQKLKPALMEILGPHL